MCVKFVSNEIERSYDATKPLEDQVLVTDQIVINYEPFDETLDKFVQEIERITKTGKIVALNIKVIHNNHIVGFRLKKRMSRASNDITLNEIIKLMVLSQAEVDKKLEDLANYCTGMNCNVK